MGMVMYELSSYLSLNLPVIILCQAYMTNQPVATATDKVAKVDNSYITTPIGVCHITCIIREAFALPRRRP